MEDNEIKVKLKNKLRLNVLMKNSSLESWIKNNKRESRENYLIYREKVMLLEELLVDLFPVQVEKTPLIK